MTARSVRTRGISDPSTRAAFTASLVLALSVIALPGCDALGSDARSADGGRTLFARAAPAFAGFGAQDSVVTTTRHLPVDAGDLNGSVASISSDGRSVATTDWTTGEIVIRDLRGETQRHLFSNPAPFVPGFGMGPRITKSGDRVAYTWVPMVGDAEGQGPELRVIDLSEDGAEPRTIFQSGPWVEPMDWSADGREILVTNSREDGTVQVAIVPVDGSEPRVLRALGWNGPRNAAFSPDGRWIAFDFPPEDDSRRRDIQVLAADGSDGRVVVEGDSDDWLLGWSPDGYLLFVSDRGGTPGAWRLPMSGGRAAGAPELVKPDLWRISPLGFDGEGRLFYVHMEGGAGVHVASIDPESGRVVGVPNKVDPRALGHTLQSAWSPDGRHLAYLTEERPFAGGADRVLVVLALESGEVRELRVPPPTQGLAAPRWTPDGRAILLRAQYDRGETNLLRVDVQTGAVERVLQAVDLYPTFEVFPDGRRVVFAERLPPEAVPPAEDGEPRGGQRLIVRGLDDDSEVELYRHIGITVNPHLAIWRVALSPDGSRVAFTRTHRWGAVADGSGDLVVMDVEGGEPEVIAELNPALMNSLAWSADGEYLLYAMRVAGLDPEARLWRVRPGGSPEELGRFAEGLGGIQPHPDGRRIAFETGTVNTSLWVMENIAPVVRRSEAGGSR